MNLKFSSLLLLCVAIHTTTNSAVSDVAWQSDLDAARKIAQETNRPILCHFGAVWCGPCQKMERSVFPRREVRYHLSQSVVGVKIDVNKNPELARRFGVTQFPTDIFLEPSGTEILKTTGFKQVSEYTALMVRARTRYQDLLVARELNSKRSPDSTVLPVQPDSDQVAMLGGYCPVTLWKSRRWVKGSPRIRGQYQGQIYEFATEEELKEFKLSPERYVPQFLGCDPVIVWESDRAVPGETEFGAFYDEQLFLFASNENRTQFKKSPDRYLRAQVVLSLDQIETSIK